MNIFLQFQGHTRVVTPEQVQQLIHANQLYQEGFIFTCRGKQCLQGQSFLNEDTVYVQAGLKGGKGGFGAKLKTEGGKKVRPNDNMYSKDLQGRPIAYANIAKEYETYYTKKVQEDMKVEQQLKDFKVIANTYKESYASSKMDSTYNAEIQANERKIEDSMKEGLKKYLQRRKDEAITKNQSSESRKDSGSEEKEEKPNHDEPEEEGDQIEREGAQSEGQKRERPNEDELKPSSAIKKVKLTQTDPIQPKASAPIAKTLTASERLKSLFKK